MRMRGARSEVQHGTRAEQVMMLQDAVKFLPNLAGFRGCTEPRATMRREVEERRWAHKESKAHGTVDKGRSMEAIKVPREDALAHWRRGALGPLGARVDRVRPPRLTRRAVHRRRGGRERGRGGAPLQALARRRILELWDLWSRHSSSEGKPPKHTRRSVVLLRSRCRGLRESLTPRPCCARAAGMLSRRLGRGGRLIILVDRGRTEGATER